MNINEALVVLGLDATASFEDMRSAYRDQLMRHHPDHQSRTSGPADGPEPSSAGSSPQERTTAVIEAFRALREATFDGMQPLPASQMPVLGTEGHPIVLLASPGDVFTRLLAAVEEVGEVTFIDRESKVLGATINIDGFAASQLSAEVADSDDGEADPEVQFTLETLGTGTPPDLNAVVARLAPHL